jgi:hypothetical protein
LLLGVYATSVTNIHLQRARLRICGASVRKAYNVNDRDVSRESSSSWVLEITIQDTPVMCSSPAFAWHDCSNVYSTTVTNTPWLCGRRKHGALMRSAATAEIWMKYSRPEGI